MEKKCYSCKHRGSVSGSAHSSCRFVRTIFNEEKATEVEIGLSMRIFEMKDPGTGQHKVKLNEYGVKSGWANWPVDFDPTWVESCELFEPNS